VETATLTIDPAFTVAPVNRRLFGSFVEHMGRCVYTGIYEPGHPSADADGFRTDVLELVRELGVSLVRYPGGNFVSGYDWQDGVGPREQRPRTAELAWQTVESNQVGTDEFLAWCGRAGVEPMLAVNLGTRGVAEAVALLEYCNAETGTRYADLRAANGHPEPYGVRIWCLGNEMDGPWQIGNRSPQEYAGLAEQAARAMKRLQPDLELVACGSSGPRIATFGQWESEVLQRCGEVAEHISLHAYYGPHGDLDSFLACSADMERYIHAVVATADAVAARRQSRTRTTLSFDEWNVWFAVGGSEETTDPDDDVSTALRSPDAPQRLAEDAYGPIDAVVVGSMLMVLLRNADRVAMACLAQLVNVIAPIMTEPGGPAWRQSIFHPFALTSRHARGTVLQTASHGPTIDTPAWGRVDQLLSTATWDSESGDLAIWLVNRSPAEPLQVQIQLADAAAHATPWHLREHLTLSDGSADASGDRRDAPAPTRVQTTTVADRTVRCTLPAGSWHLVRLAQSPTA